MKKTLKKAKKIVLYILIIPTAIFKIFFNIKKDTVDFQIPWITFEAKEWLENYLKKDMTAFEWGSGGSTLFIAPKVKQITSVEHDKVWYTKVKTYLKLKKISNCQYKLIKPERKNDNKKYSSSSFDYKSSAEAYPDFSFENYCRFIDSFPDNYFDLIVIDGRARNSCILYAKKKVKKGGYILLDNSEIKEYDLGVAQLAPDFERKDFWGRGPFIDTPWKTSVFFRKK